MVFLKDHVAFWAREGATTCTFGYAAAGMPASTTIVHQPFNACKKMPVPIIRVGHEEHVLSDARVPQIIADTKIEPQEIDFNDMFFNDPFLMLCLLPNKTMTGAATWGAGNTGTITGDFTVETYWDSIMYQVKVYDAAVGASHLEYTFHGGEITQYQLAAEEGKLLRENVKVKFMDMVSNSRAFTTDANFDDGGTRPNAAWDDDGPFHSKDVSYEWNGSAPAGIQVKKGTLTIKTPRPQEHLQNSQKVQIHYLGSPLEFEVVLEGLLSTNAQVTEVLLAYASKTKQTFEFIYNDAGGAEERKFQCTQVYLKNYEFEGDGIPEAGNPVKCKLTFKNGVSNAGVKGAISYSGKWTGHVDPYHATIRRVNVAAR